MSRHPLGYKTPKVPHHTLSLHRVSLGDFQLPDVIDMSARCPPVIDQGNIGSCTGCSGVGAIGTLARKQAADGAWNGDPIIGSALALYYEERMKDGTVDQDAGSSIADSVQVLSDLGCLPDSAWPYDPNKIYDSPPVEVLDLANHTKLVDSAPVSYDLDTIRADLAMGFPIQIGVLVYSSFETDAVAASGDVPMPDPSIESQLGGHAILIVGYDHTRQVFKFRNSWGTSWGAQGYGTLPYQMVLDRTYCSELYVYRRVAQS